MAITMRATSFLVLFEVLCAITASPQLSEGAKAAILINQRYRVFPDITYARAGETELKLDVYDLQKASSPTPVIMYIHGGGWATGTKTEEMLWLLPYLQAGWAAVNVEYRISSVSPAPAAVEDCRCALRWLRRNAERYKFDLNRIVVTGASAGGHLALMTALVPDDAGFDNRCLADDDPNWTGQIPPAPRVAAVINWFGPTDLMDLLHHGAKTAAISWLGSRAGEESANRVSPISYVRSGVPPVLTIHGDVDPLVPYSEAVRLHDALTKAGVRNQLFTIHGGKHGEFAEAQALRAYEVIQQFIQMLNLAPIQH